MSKRVFIQIDKFLSEVLEHGNNLLEDLEEFKVFHIEEAKDKEQEKLKLKDEVEPTTKQSSTEI